MSVIAFWSSDKKETGQTLSMAALTTYMAAKHNYKILSIGTDYNEETLESCYWDMEKSRSLISNITKNKNSEIGLESGVEGLIKVINSNKTSNSIVSNYAKIVYKDRFDLLCSPITKDYSEYCEICKMYIDIINIANRNYDYVFIDISKKMPESEVKKILEMADVIVLNITQRLKTIIGYDRLKATNDFFSKSNILLNIGRYDKNSKYNVKNISRVLRAKKELNVIPYNTLFFETCSEGTIAEFFLRMRRIDPEDKNSYFITEVDRLTNDLIFLIKELQIRR